MRNCGGFEHGVGGAGRVRISVIYCCFCVFLSPEALTVTASRVSLPRLMTLCLQCCRWESERAPRAARPPTHTHHTSPTHLSSRYTAAHTDHPRVTLSHLLRRSWPLSSVLTSEDSSSSPRSYPSTPSISVGCVGRVGHPGRHRQGLPYRLRRKHMRQAGSACLLTTRDDEVCHDKFNSQQQQQQQQQSVFYLSRFSEF